MAWLIFNDAMLSVVEYTGDPEFLLVRSRVEGDIERVLGQCEVKRTPSADYLFRTTARRDVVASAVAERVAAVRYPNFKDSVREDARHSAYSGAWSALLRLQGNVGRYAVRR